MKNCFNSAVEVVVVDTVTTHTMKCNSRNKKSKMPLENFGN